MKDGLANLYWFRADLLKAWLRAGVDKTLAHAIYGRIDAGSGRPVSKREMMDALYLEMRDQDFNTRLGISRRFVQYLVQHKSFSPQDPKHRVDVAERCALKLQKRIDEQRRNRRDVRPSQTSSTVSEPTREQARSSLAAQFDRAHKLPPQERGYELEHLFPALLRLSGITVEGPFRVAGEQIDGAFKYDGHYYLVELKWVSRPVNQPDIASLYLKVEGKLEARGLFIAMNGYSKQLLESLPKGKNLRVLLLDGRHLVGAIYGQYGFNALLDHALKEASLRGAVYPSHELIT